MICVDQKLGGASEAAELGMQIFEMRGRGSDSQDTDNGRFVLGHDYWL